MPNSGRIRCASSNSKQVAVALAGERSKIHYFELGRESQTLEEVLTLRSGVASGSLVEILCYSSMIPCRASTSVLFCARERSQFIAVGLHDCTVRVLSVESGSWCTQKLQMRPVSVRLVPMNSPAKDGVELTSA